MSDAIDQKNKKKKFVFKELVFDDLRLVSGGDGDGGDDGGGASCGCGSDADNSSSSGDAANSDGGCVGPTCNGPIGTCDSMACNMDNGFANPNSPGCQSSTCSDACS